MEATLRLFKALPVHSLVNGPIDTQLAARTVRQGFVFDRSVTEQYRGRHSYLIRQVNAAYGRDGAELNQALHKSFAKVRDTSQLQLAAEQIIHYLTTYGAQAAGVYSPDHIYIPAEQLELPTDDLRLIVIHGWTNEQIKDALLRLLASGVALAETTVADCVEVAQMVRLGAEEISQVANREVRAALYDQFNIMPADPTEFLRLVIYRATNQTLLIKDRNTLAALRERNNNDLARYFLQYEHQHGLHRLAQVFYRFRPLFLAMRSNSTIRRCVNRISRIAPVHHQPMQPDLLNEVTARLKSGQKIDVQRLTDALESANTFRKVRLAQALKFRASDASSIMYRIRNGRSWATSFQCSQPELAAAYYEIVMDDVVRDLAARVQGKRIYIPQGLHYGLPATEKQFTGNLPSGSYVRVDSDLVCGVHWFDYDGVPVDLDLSVANTDGKIGWDARGRDNERGIWFSGDLVVAPPPRGASEVFRFSSRARGCWLMSVNHFNRGGSNVSIPFKIVAGSEHGPMERRHVVDPAQLIAYSQTEMDCKQKTLGIVFGDPTKWGPGLRFYFAETGAAGGRSARHTKVAEWSLQYLLSYYTNVISLNDALVAAGAIIVETEAQADINLSHEAIDRTSILGLLAKTPVKA